MKHDEAHAETLRFAARWGRVQGRGAYWLREPERITAATWWALPGCAVDEVAAVYREAFLRARATA